MPIRPPVDSFRRLCFDIETYDPRLRELGPGVYRDDGYLIGCAITDGNFSEYYSLRDRDTDRGNYEYLAELLGSRIPKAGFNVAYDIQWLKVSGIEVNGRLYDAMIAEALLDEERRSYTLGPIAKDYGHMKMLPEIEQWLIDNNHKVTYDAFAQNLADAPDDLVRLYNISDAEISLKIMQTQLERIKLQGLDRVFRLESDLIRTGLLMRDVGVRIDTDKRDKNADQLTQLISGMYQETVEKYDLDVILLTDAVENDGKIPGYFNYNSSQHVGTVLARQGHIPPMQVKDDSKYSVVQDWLKTVAEHSELAANIFTLRKADKLEKTFLRKALRENLTDDGLIHCQFHSTREEWNGTRSGRYSSSKPNLQQVPSPSANIMAGRLCRECFIPYTPSHKWGKLDYSQLEYRVFAHYAVGDKSDEIRERYNDDPNTDYHQYVVDMTGLRRRTAKVFNFSKLFGSGAKGLSDTMGVTVREVWPIINQYDENIPYSKTTMDAFMEMAQRKCFTRTALGRRSRFNQDDVRFHIALSRTIQGTAAEVIKEATRKAHQDGLFDILIPHMTVHDELDVSVPDTPEGAEAFRELHHTMETALPLRVPLVVESEIMEHWGDEAEYRGKDEQLYSAIR